MICFNGVVDKLFAISLAASNEAREIIEKR